VYAFVTSQLPAQGLDFIEHNGWQWEKPATIAYDVTRQGWRYRYNDLRLDGEAPVEAAQSTPGVYA
jgi:hypothetical protein